LIPPVMQNSWILEKFKYEAQKKSQYIKEKTKKKLQ
jgi:hypothetical protein